MSGISPLRCVVLMLCMGASVEGADSQFGADGIPYLVREVEYEKGVVVIVEGLQTVQTAEDSRARLYVGRVQRIVYPAELPENVRPHVQANVPVRIAVLRETASFSSDRPTTSIAFLYPPLSAEAAKRYGVSTDNNDAPVFLSVNGAFGIIPTTNGARAEAILEYVISGREKRIAWATKYVESEDPLLQRSAVLETTVQPRSGEPVLELCSTALRSDRVSWSNKEVAITALQNSRAGAALTPLQELAVNSNAPLTVRSSALRAMRSVPGGVDVLTDFKESADAPWLRSASREALRPLEQPVDDSSSATPQDEVISRLRNGKSLERREAIESSGSLGYSKDLGDALKLLATDSKEKPAVRELALERLAAFNNRAAADLLSHAAKDSSLSTEFRSSAIMAIARIETGISETVLAELAGSLSELDLKNLAKGLLDR